MKRLAALLRRRPTEAATGTAGLAVTYGFLTQAGVSPPLAAILAVLAGLLPATITAIADLTRRK